MNPKYIKCVLTKGFAVVEEKLSRPIEDCFPIVTFFDDNGKALGQLGYEKLAKLYQTIYEIWPILSTTKENLEDRDIGDLGDYKIQVRGGLICINGPLDLKLETRITPYIVMDRPVAMKFVESINVLV